MKNIKQRFIEDMKLRGLAESTQKRYLDSIKALANHFYRRPDQITQEQVRNYLIYLIEPKGCAKNTFNVDLCAIKFLYQKTLGRDWRFLQIACVKTHKGLPIVLSREEVWSLLDLILRPKPLMGLTLMYTCGLRVSEAVNLRLEDIDSERMVVWVRNGKGNKDRSVPLPTQTLAQLRAYWSEHRPKIWLFPSKKGTVPITNSRIISIDNGKVTFRCKGSRGSQTRTMTVSAEEFIRRFLQHVLPAGFHKVRYYGLWSPSNRKKLLEVQQILTQSGNDQQVEFEEDMDAEAPPPSEARKCPHCQRGTLIWIRRLPRQGRAPP